MTLFVYVDCLSSNQFTLKNYLSDILCYVYQVINYQLCLSSNQFTLKNYLSDILCYVHLLKLLINLVYLFQHIPYPKTRVTVFKTVNVFSY